MSVDRDLKNDEKFLPARVFTAGNVSATYEAGRVRYIRYKGYEVLRLIFCTMRDETWVTIPFTISNEEIKENGNDFSINFHAVFRSGTIHFEADLRIAGANDSIVFEMNGKSFSSFKTKRTGLGVHHPIPSTAGRNVDIIHEHDKIETSLFPVLISAERPFTDVTGMRWTTADGVEASLKFEGDLFETEDQRNWSDDSYKTYSGPQYKVPMVFYNNGDKMLHRVTLKMKDSVPLKPFAKSGTKINELRSSFPKIGFVYRPLAGISSDKLKRLPHGHLLVESKLKDANWKKDFSTAVADARANDFKIRWQVYFELFSEAEAEGISGALQEALPAIASLLVLPGTSNTPQTEQQSFVYNHIKKFFPSLPVGFGSVSWFSYVNTAINKDVACDFTGFVITPQVHQTDHRSILENLLSQPAIIETIDAKTGGKPSHINLHFSRNGDKRIHSEFAAWWTLNAIAGLAGAGVITVFDISGDDGVIGGNGNRDTPVYELLAEITAFGAVEIWFERDADVQDPMSAVRSSRVCVRNGHGETKCFTMRDI